VWEQSAGHSDRCSGKANYCPEWTFRQPGGITGCFSRGPLAGFVSARARSALNGLFRQSPRDRDEREPNG
jgi:hypothetical protein